MRSAPCRITYLSVTLLFAVRTTMSRLTTYWDLVTRVLDEYDGKRPSNAANNIEPLELRKQPIILPLFGAEQTNGVSDFYWQRFKLCEDRSIAPQREYHHYKLCEETLQAYEVLYREVPCEAGVNCLVSSLRHIQTALDWATGLKDYDDDHPIRKSEWFEATDDENARTHWIKFKLDSIRPCLWLLVQVLKFMLPKNEDLLKASEDCLQRADWDDQFIYDSQRSQNRTRPRHPNESDVRAHESSNRKLGQFSPRALAAWKAQRSAEQNCRLPKV